MKRTYTLEQAKALFVHRFTMEHIPQWVRDRPTPRHSGGTADWFYAPQYRSDQEWYDNTKFFGEPGHIGTSRECCSSNATWPLGMTLDKPYSKK
jgi:hypothetical protein